MSSRPVYVDTLATQFGKLISAAEHALWYIDIGDIEAAKTLLANASDEAKTKTKEAFEAQHKAHSEEFSKIMDMIKI